MMPDGQHSPHQYINSSRERKSVLLSTARPSRCPPGLLLCNKLLFWNMPSLIMVMGSSRVALITVMGSSQLAPITVTGSSQLAVITVMGSSRLALKMAMGRSQLALITVTGSSQLAVITVTGSSHPAVITVIGSFPAGCNDRDGEFPSVCNNRDGEFPAGCNNHDGEFPDGCNNRALLSWSNADVDPVKISRLPAREISEYRSFRDVTILHFNLPDKVKLATWRFNATEHLISSSIVSRCRKRGVSLYLKYGSYPVVNPDNSSFPENYYNVRVPIYNVTFRSDSVEKTVNIVNPMPGDWFAVTFLSYTDPNDDQILQQGISPNCAALLQSSVDVVISSVVIDISPGVAIDQTLTVDINIIVCITYDVRAIPIFPNLCFNHMNETSHAHILVNTTSEKSRNGVVHVPHPENGLWYVTYKPFCYNSTFDSEGNASFKAVECGDLDEVGVSYGVESYPCGENNCGQFGHCFNYNSGGLIYSSCVCLHGYTGWGCTDDSKVSSLGDLLVAALLLTLSNLLFIPAIIIAIRRKFFTESFVYACIMFFSTFYHACDAGEDIYSYCIFKLNTLQFCDFYSAILAIWVTLIAMADLNATCKSLAHMAGAVGIALENLDVFVTFTKLTRDDCLQALDGPSQLLMREDYGESQKGVKHEHLTACGPCQRGGDKPKGCAPQNSESYGTFIVTPISSSCCTVEWRRETSVMIGMGRSGLVNIINMFQQNSDCRQEYIDEPTTMLLWSQLRRDLVSQQNIRRILRNPVVDRHMNSPKTLIVSSGHSMLGSLQITKGNLTHFVICRVPRIPDQRINILDCQQRMPKAQLNRPNINPKRQTWSQEKMAEAVSIAKRQRISSSSSDKDSMYILSFVVSLSDLPDEETPPSKDDTACLFCDGLFTDDAHGEVWVQCLMCAMWAHKDCADVEKEHYICDLEERESLNSNRADSSCYNALDIIRREPTFAWRESGKPFEENHPSSTERDYNFGLPVLNSLVQHETSALRQWYLRGGGYGGSIKAPWGRERERCCLSNLFRLRGGGGDVRPRESGVYRCRAEESSEEVYSSLNVHGVLRAVVSPGCEEYDRGGGSRSRRNLWPVSFLLDPIKLLALDPIQLRAQSVFLQENLWLVSFLEIVDRT
uniref:EGF-like domain-containing protein n=1 Tax=Timema shepardi TaxID=629360 RepID=A0A7R9FZX6_TIMSH|nr:unnamed protein product [Timema shepardi]